MYDGPSRLVAQPCSIASGTAIPTKFVCIHFSLAECHQNHSLIDVQCFDEDPHRCPRNVKGLSMKSDEYSFYQIPSDLFVSTSAYAGSPSISWGLMAEHAETVYNACLP